MSQALFEQLRAAVQQRPPRRLGPPRSEVALASVLIPFFERDGEPWLLFVKRPDGSYRHAGQIAFPGGKRDGGETALQCALREAQEEVGLDPKDVEVYGELDEYDTIVTGFRITPIVGKMPYPYPLKPDPFEVERIIEVPLARLLDLGILRTELRKAFGLEIPVYYYQVGDDLIWGVTAGMLTPLLGMIRELPACPR